MVYRIVVLSAAERVLDEFPQAIRERFIQAFETLVTYPAPTARVEKLKKPLMGYKRRVGDYRLILDIGDGVIFVRDIRNRKDAYRK